MIQTKMLKVIKIFESMYINLFQWADLQKNAEKYKLKKSWKKKIKSYVTMDKEIIKADDTEIEKYKFH